MNNLLIMYLSITYLYLIHIKKGYTVTPYIPLFINILINITICIYSLLLTYLFNTSQH